MTSAHYGIPYMGSKSRIAMRIIEELPAGPVLIDAFAGGCAVTHAALASGKWASVVANDIGDGPALFYHACKRGVHSWRWVSRAEFFAKKDLDPEIRWAWSFGNVGRSYLHSRKIEPFKRAGHLAVVDGDFSGYDKERPDAPSTLRRMRRIVEQALSGVSGIRDRYSAYRSAIRRLQELQELQGLERPELLQGLQGLGRLRELQELEGLGRLQELQGLEGLERLTATCHDYRDLHIPKSAVIYCDPPYRDTANSYAAPFSYDAFYQWARAVGRRYTVYISEYWMPPDFECVSEFEVQALAAVGAAQSQKRVERLYILKK